MEFHAQLASGFELSWANILCENCSRGGSGFVDPATNYTRKVRGSLTFQHPDLNRRGRSYMKTLSGDAINDPSQVSGDCGVVSCLLSFLAPLEAILFDIDGTLCDSDPVHYYAFRDMLQEIGFNGGVPITEEFFVKTISGKHNGEPSRILLPEWDFQRAMKFMDDKEAMFRR
ncbi:hypothetical protein HYC85_016693 [Camellia sinensis]|uniref:Haloacid dehalogenase-like hydrolase domain-containing protein Sgpp n=1 Tax=Camellia sinensis TaxID=4442 RepID=A0A7J7H1N3_CAMSI|nr:hypothetical protein HYC85_016693 [Camellia sinensis]